ncbi:TPA: 4Fe-4S dicluster domain-containing protein [Raoultella planticola]|uniref:4Fe-4S binding protein n=1 Tax=Raoultella planticola TaxID=575 RepID=UPI001A21244E|nr:4Fe-4S dicluster domain-containing protein [Raoultella planticola]
MNRFIIADAQKCIGCRTCEVACVVSHQPDQSCTTVSAPQFAPRIRVVKSDELSTATLCRQCEDAPCANVCPVDAIQREDAAWYVDQRRCIGCKSCMVACPYGAITVMFTAEGVQALKCDLCRHRAEGPACIAACPTQALRCLEGTELERLSAQRRRRMALTM